MNNSNSAAFRSFSAFVASNLLESLRCFWVGERGSHLCPAPAGQLRDAWDVAAYWLQEQQG